MRLVLKYRDRSLIAVLLVTLYLRAIDAVQCYEGRQYDDDVGRRVDTVQLAACPKHKQCCFALSSLNGRTFACSEYCPERVLLSCGPDPSWNMMDLSYCYCRSYLDPNCHPATFAVEKHNRSISLRKKKSRDFYFYY